MTGKIVFYMNIQVHDDEQLVMVSSPGFSSVCNNRGSGYGYYEAHAHDCHYCTLLKTAYVE